MRICESCCSPFEYDVCPNCGTGYSRNLMSEGVYTGCKNDKDTDEKEAAVLGLMLQNIQEKKVIVRSKKGSIFAPC